MRTNFTNKIITCVIIIMSISFSNTNTFAQQAIPSLTEIVSYITGDTLQTGARKNTSYTLARGGVYFSLGTIQNNFPLTISATGDTSLPRPELIVMTDSKGNYSQPFKPYKNLTIQGLFMTGVNTSGSQVPDLIETGTTNVDVTLNNCIIDSVSTRIIIMDQNYCSVFAYDCYIHNVAGGSHNGRFIDARETVADTIIVQNCTFYNIMHTLVNRFSGGQLLFKFDHNTVYNIMRNDLRMDESPNLIVTNNLFLNTGFCGFIPAWEAAFDTNDLGDRDEWSRIEIWPLDSTFPGATQQINFKYNNFWINPAIQASFPDTIWPYKTLDFTFEKQMVGNDTLTWVNENVNFGNVPTCNYLGIAEQAWVNGSPQTDPGFTDATRPYNFAYSTSSASYTAGANGFPLGDLNWWPAKKAAWENSLTDVKANKSIPLNFTLEQNYPNPFNPSTVIKYSIPEASSVKLKVFNVLGKEVATLVNLKQQAGEYNVTFNIKNLASGVYFYTISAGQFTSSKKMILLK
jgi:hypothetical protein